MERNIELRSEKVRNIIGQIPPVLLRYGAAIIGAALLAMVSTSAFIPYQETLPIEVTIKTIPEIHEVNASSSGIFIANKSIEKYIEKIVRWVISTILTRYYPSSLQSPEILFLT